ncbi:class I SAM-dependent methyltransferase [Streptomyces sp. BR1]|uniref:class I SAM-dependent methyltransferase n=1 Tax=Streptomyces sp. BR1 TaxID=1592323 RepID=UPI00402B25A0
MSDIHGHDGHDSDANGGHGARRHGHTHGHQHGTGDIDWATMAAFLVRSGELYSPIYRQAAAWIGDQRPLGEVRRILDIGSGPGVVTCLLAEVFPAAEVVAVDASRGLLDHAQARAERLGLADRFHTIEAELPDDIGTLGEADLIWAGNSLHHIGDQRAALARFAELLRPGGTVVLVEGGLPSRHLPRDIGMGRPGLQARFDVVVDEWFNRMRAELPGAKEETEDWSALLASVGLTPTGTRSFLLDCPAPLDPVVREQVVADFSWAWEAVGEELSQEDQAVVRRLLDPADEAGLARRGDVFMLAARSIHTARRDG